MDATAAGGSAPACAPNVRAAFAELLRRSEQTNLESIKAPMRLCDDTPLGSPEDVMDVALWAQGAFDYLAMGNFPYASSYILNGDGTLPPYPFRVACGGAMADPKLLNKGGDALLSALADAVGVYYNYSKTQECFDTQHGSNDDSDEDVARKRHKSRAFENGMRVIIKPSIMAKVESFTGHAILDRGTPGKIVGSRIKHGCRQYDIEIEVPRDKLLEQNPYDAARIKKLSAEELKVVSREYSAFEPQWFNDIKLDRGAN